VTWGSVANDEAVVNQVSKGCRESVAADPQLYPHDRKSGTLVVEYSKDRNCPAAVNELEWYMND